MLFSEAVHRRVVATDTAATIGRVDDVVVDPRTRAVAALRLDGRGGDVLHWSDVASFGADAVTVDSADARRAPAGRTAGLLGRNYQVVGKRLLTDLGDELGRVLDVDFDPNSGSILNLFTTSGRIHGARLVGCGSYAVVVRMD
jgi:sporulation protein YlmC with PRC-barrel domain